MMTTIKLDKSLLEKIDALDLSKIRTAEITAESPNGPYYEIEAELVNSEELVTRETLITNVSGIKESVLADLLDAACVYFSGVVAEDMGEELTDLEQEDVLDIVQDHCFSVAEFAKKMANGEFVSVVRDAVNYVIEHRLMVYEILVSVNFSGVLSVCARSEEEAYEFIRNGSEEDFASDILNDYGAYDYVEVEPESVRDVYPKSDYLFGYYDA